MIMARRSAILALRILTMMLAACAGNASCDTVRSVKRTVLLLDGTGRCVDGIDVVPTASAADLLCLSTFNETELVPAGLPPLEELLKRLKEGMFNDVLAVLYPGCNEDITIIAKLLNTNMLQIPLITFSFPPVPTTSLMLPYHIHMVPSEAALPHAMHAVIQQYGWRRAAVLTQDVSVFTVLTDQLLSLWENSGVSVMQQLLLDSSMHVDMDPQDLFGDDVRIFVLNMYPNLTREVLCKARHLDHSSGYVWITHGWYGDEWWKNGRSECSGEHLETYLDGVIGVTHYPTTDSEHDSYPISSGDVVCDAVRAVALALNNSAVNASREDFRKEIYNLSFRGSSGPVSFQNGVRTAGPIRIIQYGQDGGVGLTRRTVALVHLNSDKQTDFNFTYTNGEDVSSVWPAGIPSDGTPIEVQHYPFLSLLVIVYLYTVTGLVFTVVCLVFNIVFRKHKLIRLSSPKLNYLIIVGAIMMYLCSPGFFYIEGSSSTLIAWQCNLRTFTASLGYSVAYGTINAKIWRVYYICTKAKPTMQGNVPLKDWHLMLMVLGLLLVDSIIIIIVLSLDNARYSVTIIPNKQDPGFTRNDDGIKEVSVVSRCHSPTEPYWLGILFGYKIIIQVLGVFLAFKIRKVKIRGLNESREVSAILYITSTILAVMIVTTFAFGDYIDVDSFIFAVGLCTATTVVLVFTFVTKMWGLYNDPEGKHVLEGVTTASTSEAPCSGTSSSEVAALQSRIRELERLVNQEPSCSTHNTHNGTSTC